MNDPRRWLDDATISESLRRTLEAAGAPSQVSPALHAQLTDYTLTLASRAALSKVAGTGIARQLWLKVGASKLLVLAGLTGGAALGTFGVLSVIAPSQPNSRAPSISASAPASHGERLLLPVASNSGVGTAVPPVEPQSAPPPRSASLRTGVNVATSEAQIPNSSSIADEAKLLEDARALLGTAPSAALALTEQHQQRFARAQLTAERELIAIAALLRLGRRMEAEHRAAPRLEQAPDSVYARRLRQLLGVPTDVRSKNQNE